MRMGVILALVVAVGAAALLIGLSGESGEEKAQSDVCDARAKISTEVETLQKLTPETVTTDAVSASVDAIRGDLEEIRDASDELSQDRRNELKAANDAFVAEVTAIASTVLRETTAADAKAQLTTAADELAATYRSTLGEFDCS